MIELKVEKSTTRTSHRIRARKMKGRGFVASTEFGTGTADTATEAEMQALAIILLQDQEFKSYVGDVLLGYNR